LGDQLFNGVFCSGDLAQIQYTVIKTGTAGLAFIEVSDNAAVFI